MRIKERKPHICPKCVYCDPFSESASSRQHTPITEPNWKLPTQVLCMTKTRELVVRYPTKLWGVARKSPGKHSPQWLVSKKIKLSVSSHFLDTCLSPPTFFLFYPFRLSSLFPYNAENSMWWIPVRKGYFVASLWQMFGDICTYNVDEVTAGEKNHFLLTWFQSWKWLGLPLCLKVMWAIWNWLCSLRMTACFKVNNIGSISQCVSNRSSQFYWRKNSTNWSVLCFEGLEKDFLITF